MLDYQAYRTINEPQKVATLLELDLRINQVDSKDAKQFLGLLIYDKTETDYNRRKGFDILGRLTLLNRISIEGTLDKILDIELSDDHFLILKGIKLSQYFYKIANLKVTAWLKQFLYHSDAEVRSEALFALGKIHLESAMASPELKDYAMELQEARNRFNESCNEIENRIDAAFYKEMADFLFEVKFPDKGDIEALLQSIKLHLVEFIYNAIDDFDASFYANIIESLEIVKIISISQPDSWTEFRKEFNEILIELQKLNVLILCQEIVNGSSISEYAVYIKNHLLNDVLITKFQLEKKRLRTLYNDPTILSSEQKLLVNSIIELIESKEIDKKKDTATLIPIIAKFHMAFPLIPMELLTSDLELIDFANPTGLADLVCKYTDLAEGIPNNSLSTGYTQGDEILNEIKSEIRQKIPGYPDLKFIELILVLKDVVNYFINSTRGSKSRFDFLFRANALEADLQNSMLTFLQSGERAGRYLPELKEFADGGRVDIVYNGVNIQIPIELKRSFETLSWNVVLNCYIAQAQTYAYSRDQLSIFVVMDLSPRNAGKPEADIRSLFSVLQLPTRQNVGENMPDYVIAFIIPGNKFSPSERTKY